MAAADPATGVAGPSLVEALRARKTAVQSISAASNGGRDSQGAVDAYVSRRRAIRRRHSVVNQGRGGRVVAREIVDNDAEDVRDLMEKRASPTRDEPGMSGTGLPPSHDWQTNLLLLVSVLSV